MGREKFCNECAKQRRKEKKPKRIAIRWIGAKFVCEYCFYRIRRENGNGKDKRKIEDINEFFTQI
ncbi:MAG: hypothetical protein KAJ49_03355 [Arcobacteraceae bacterium]|nr:hypothetical protein [Arcobacteraceae bacterium]